MNEVGKKLMKIGLVQCIVAAVTFAIVVFAWQFIVHTFLLKIVVGFLLLGYLGPPMLLVGASLWSWNKSRMVRGSVWCISLLVLLFFVPITFDCTGNGDVLLCTGIVYPFQLEYWSKAYDSVFGKENYLDHWDSIGWHIYVEEGLGDATKELLK